MNSFKPPFFKSASNTFSLQQEQLVLDIVLLTAFEVVTETTLLAQHTIDPLAFFK
jgi:hypothetical protein